MAGLGAASAAMAAPALALRGLRQSDDIRVAVVGTRGRGNGLMQQAQGLKGVSVKAICDVDTSVLGRRAAEFEQKFGYAPDQHQDYRELLKDKSIDAVIIATPNHLHALYTIWACQAGKDVYVEKPVSHNIWEGGQMVKAARKYGRIVQSGTQSRSSHGIRDAIAWIHGGNLGKITHGWGTCFKPRGSIGNVDGAQPVPESVDWDIYMGPRGPKPLTRRQLHYDWHWQQDTGNGDLGNQGVHQMDIGRWALGEDALPPRVISIGGRLGYDDDGDTPNTMFTMFDYAAAPMFFEVRGMPRDKAGQKEWGKSMDRRLGMGVGTVLHTEAGHVTFPNYSRAKAYDSAGRMVKEWNGADDHMENFFSAVRSRRMEDLNADIQKGHISSALCHMGNDALYLGAAAEPLAMERDFASTPTLSHGLDRMLAHLAANEVDLGATPITLGAELRLDTQTESYIDNDAANTRARGTYVDAFAVPEEV